MSLKIYNVLTRKKEEFIPQEEGKVKMYACGITASGDAHIGHGYQAIVFDVIRNYLEYLGYEVTYVRNYTDVDDKIILKARELGVNPLDYANRMMKKIDKELKELYIKEPTIQSKATDSIHDMIEFIKKLIDKGHAYATNNGDVFFKVSSFKDYGRLSNRNIDKQLNGVRKDIEPGKIDVRDFALWKSAKDDEIFWDSPWGKGRPGWHIECSVMSMKYLGETLDIHGGGKDLIFPHHENEIAQSEALTGKTFSRYWIHNGLVKVDGQKMSKSLNNGILLEDLLNKYNAESIRLTLLQNNYKSDLNVTDEILEQNEKTIYTIYKLFAEIDTVSKNTKVNKSKGEYINIINDFKEAMDNDFNTSLALSYLYVYIKDINKLIKQKDIEKLINIKSAIIDIYGVLELFQKNPRDVITKIRDKYLTRRNITEEEINKLVNKLNEYREIKDYENADQIRDFLKKKEIIINDNKWDII